MSDINPMFPLSSSGSSTTVLDAPLVRNFQKGYIDSGNGTFVFENNSQSVCDIFAVESGHKYSYNFGTLGTRWRVLFTTTDLRTVSSGTVQGTAVRNLSTPKHKQYEYTATDDGFLVFQKSNTAELNTTVYCFDSTGET